MPTVSNGPSLGDVRSKRRRGGETQHPVLVVTGSAALAESVERLAAAAGVVLHPVTEAAQARRLWPSAALVLVGADQALDLPRAPSRRDGVILVCDGATAPEQERAVWRYAVDLGAERVVVLPEASGWLVERLSDAVEGRPHAPVVGVAGGRGGVGASSLLVGLGVVAARAGLASVLVDADPLGADLDLLLDSVDEPGLRWPDLAASHGRLPSGSLAAALPQVGGVSVLSSPPDRPPAVPPAAMEAVLPALARCHDLVLVDLPRWWDATGAAALGQCQVVLVLASADTRGAAATLRLLQRLDRDHDVRLVVRAGRGGLDPEGLADDLGLPLAAVIRPDARVTSDAYPGLVVRGSLERACRALLPVLAPAPAR